MACFALALWLDLLGKLPDSVQKRSKHADPAHDISDSPSNCQRVISRFKRGIHIFYIVLSGFAVVEFSGVLEMDFERKSIRDLFFAPFFKDKAF